MFRRQGPPHLREAAIAAVTDSGKYQSSGKPVTRSNPIMYRAARTIRSVLPSALAILSLSTMALSQSLANQTEPKAPKLDDIAISPSRLELLMTPGTEKTVVVNLVYTADTGHGQPVRVIA